MHEFETLADNKVLIVYINPIFATYLRITRFIAFLTSIFIAGLYVALVNFHQEMIPTKLLISLVGQREGYL